MNQAEEIVLPTDSGLISTGSGPADVMILATFKLLRLSERPLEIGDRPFGAFDGRGGAVVADGALADTAVELLARRGNPTCPLEAVSRYFWKLSVVPDSSLRNTTRIGSSGSFDTQVQQRIAASFHMVIWPLKIWAAAGPSRFSDVTPLTLKAMAMGPTTIGRFHAGEPHRCCALAYSSMFSGESDPPKSVWLLDEIR